LESITRFDKDLGQKVISCVNTPAMINLNYSTTYSEHIGVHNPTRRDREEFCPDLAAKIQPAVKGILGAAIIGAAVTEK
jgi:hypothetical protein